MDCELLDPRPGRCDACGKKLTGRRRRWCSRTCQRRYTENHRWTQAKAAAKRAATWFKCARCGGFFQAIEVNHIVPCKGVRTWSCIHHQSNLEVVCAPCHKEITAQQRRDGLI